MGQKTPMKIQIRPILMKFRHMDYILSKGDFQIFSSFVGAKESRRQKGVTRGQKAPMKIEIRPISMKFKPHILHNT